MTNLPIIDYDYETKSGYDLSLVGRVKYVKHKDADIICMSYKLPDSPSKLWLPGVPVPSEFKHTKEFRYRAFNIQFDSHVAATLGSRYGFKPQPLINQIDAMAVASRFGLPQKLDRLGPALNVKLVKLKTGKALKDLFCSPPYCNPKKDEAWHAQKLREFYAYCIRDSDSMYEIMQAMPMDHLPKSEQEIWMDNCRMNTVGVPVDHAAVKRINQVCDFYREGEAKKVPILTNGAVNTIGQIQKIIEWVEGVSCVTLPNLQAQTVEDTIEHLELQLQEASLYPGDDLANGFERAKDLLLLRQRIGGAAVKKYKKLDAQTTNGRIHDNSRYHGAGTGRTTGGGFQYLNMPRAQVRYDKDNTTYEEAVEAAIKSFYDTSVLKTNPLEVGKALVRPMIKAPKGKRLLVVDWSSIEYILLVWFAGEWGKVASFAAGEDPYKRFATKLFDVEYEAVTKKQRTQAKAPVLGSGYMLGWEGLIEYGAGMGIHMTDDEAQYGTNIYRNDHRLVVDSWYALKNAAHDAVRQKGMTFVTHKTTLKCVKSGQYWWLIMTLPSGRHLFYCDPKLVDGKYGLVIKHRGVNSTTKQWSWVFLKPMRIIENVIQGLGRDVLQHGYTKLLEGGFQPIMTIYDEIVCEDRAETADERLKEMNDRMCIVPPWGKDLVLRTDGGYHAERYKKG